MRLTGVWRFGQRPRAQLEAKGENLKWESFVADPIPDELNFAKAPIIDSIASKHGGPARAAAWIAYDERGVYPHLGDADLQERADFCGDGERDRELFEGTGQLGGVF